MSLAGGREAVVLCPGDLPVSGSGTSTELRGSLQERFGRQQTDRLLPFRVCFTELNGLAVEIGLQDQRGRFDVSCGPPTMSELRSRNSSG